MALPVKGYQTSSSPIPKGSSIGCAAGAPFLPKLAELAKGNLAFAVGAMVVLMVVTVDLTAPGSPLARIAERHEATPAQIALAWLLHRSPAMLPIPGTFSIAHFEENLGAASIRLDAEELRTLAAH